MNMHMKTINTYILSKVKNETNITEKLKINKSKVKGGPQCTLFPETKDELVEMVQKEIKQNGNKCSLNHIDTSKITSMRSLFYNSKFNGDISEWDVSNVTNMNCMFYNSKFNGDISEWDVSNVTDMSSMFAYSRFNKDIFDWDVSNVVNMSYMFTGSSFNQPLKYWGVSNVVDMSYMFSDSKFNQDINWKINLDCNTSNMFLNCPIEDKYKPQGVE